MHSAVAGAFGTSRSMLGPLCRLCAVPLGAVVSLCACSAQQLYAAGQAWQKTECSRIADAGQRKRCYDSTAMSYEDYQRELKQAQGSP